VRILLHLRCRHALLRTTFLPFACRCDNQTFLAVVGKHRGPGLFVMAGRQSRWRVNFGVARGSVVALVLLLDFGRTGTAADGRLYSLNCSVCRNCGSYTSNAWFCAVLMMRDVVFEQRRVWLDNRCSPDLSRACLVLASSWTRGGRRTRWAGIVKCVQQAARSLVKGSSMVSGGLSWHGSGQAWRFRGKVSA